MSLPRLYHCGRLYDPVYDTSTALFHCDEWAKWDVVPRDGLSRWACGKHINQVLAELVGRTPVDLTLKDLHDG